VTTDFNLFGLTLARFETIVLVLVRVSGMLALVPIFSQQQLPRTLRFGIGLLFTFVMVATVPTIEPMQLGPLTVAVLAQLFVGLVFGFVAYLLFTGIQFAGQIIDLQIGFAIANVINPQTSQNVTIIGEYELTLGTLLYLAINGHHLLIAGMARSFALVPLPYASAPDFLTGDVMGFFTGALLVVLQIAAPVAVSLFLVNVMLGLMARVAPQMNVFVVGFPLQIGIGLVMLIVSIPLLGAVFPGLVDQSGRQMDTVLRAMGPQGP
jgi:flagellar biosynthetic protein FliR